MDGRKAVIPWSRLEVARRGQGPAHAPVTGSPQMSGGGCSVGSRGGMALICVPVEDATVTRLSVGSQASVASCRADKAQYSSTIPLSKLPSRAECILRRTVKLRSDASEFGPNHAETLLHLELLFKTLKHQHRYKSASAVKSRIRKVRQTINPEDDQPELTELCKTDPCGANMMLDMCDMILDPSKKERLEEKQKADTVDYSRELWLTVRKSFFS